jgi:hypothetical protein
MRLCSDKEVNRVLLELRARGWRVEYGGHHLKVYTPDGTRRAVVSRTPSDHRARLNIFSDLRRMGAVINR